MSLNIIDLIKGQLGPALVSQAATQFGESESGISKAISALLPAIVGGMANNAEKPGVLDAITGAASSGMLGNLLGGSSNNSMITTILSSVFGDKIGGLMNAVSSFSGVSNSTSNSLLNMVTGATLGSVGKYAADNNLGASGVSSLLKDQKGIVSTLLPAGLSLGSLGLGDVFGSANESITSATNTISSAAGSVSSAASSVTSSASSKVSNVRENIPTVENNNDNNGGGSIWKWLLPLLLLIAVSIFLWKKCEGKKDVVTPANTEDSTMMNNSTPADTLNAANSTSTTMTKEDADIDLNGVMLKGYKGGMEEQMITFLKYGNYKNAADDEALKNVWYSFDHVNFKIGSSTVFEAGSEGQMDNLLAILKAFPESKIKVAGYTDKSGNEASNKTLSKARAEYIKKWLSDKGVAAQVIAADGYGSDFATLPATASVEDRAVDRKMAVRFAK
ncbi:OmpA family protein [Frigoriflavimonas asaccharolytica]|uniref:Outer membrane protein OmpA-like peptidoglycan-associated protein n=1 Tax=Frigoriflavimonas asaccharolytica TaxID=2735899 RepID=A0A8J8G5B6_9FLAO|nr:OmpA family protein [Frigoriflavimonas asaccharolytica]NRS91539.1 outer membrane protein OmpA-like peptidoglycan-associated protein [Frigoriflavimonas asaccharolytica]